MTVSTAPDPAPSAFDRSAHEREIEGLLVTLHGDAATRVLALHRGRAMVTAQSVPAGEGTGWGTGDAAGAVLDLAPAAAFDASDLVAFLGRVHGVPIALALVDDTAAARLAPADRWVELRAVGGELAEADAALFMTALALSRFHLDAAHCPACGARAPLRQSGWSRRCENCGREHFPRTDPAVIVAVTDAAGSRLLLGANAAWPAGRYSCFAGFVEAGESAEAALVREVHEEAGVRIAALEYMGSQGWPYPRSLMLGYLATAIDADEAEADGEEINEVRWFDADEIGAALAQDGSGGITLPGRASIARRLIETWHARSAAGELRPGVAE